MRQTKHALKDEEGIKEIMREQSMGEDRLSDGSERGMDGVKKREK